MRCAYIAFTARGLALAQRLTAACPGSVARCGVGGVTLEAWTQEQFEENHRRVCACVEEIVKGLNA